MLKFTNTSQSYPSLRPAEERKKDFNEIYSSFSPAPAALQASRCAQCGIPFCQIHCPLQNNIPDWLRLTAEGRLQEAYEMSAQTNTFPEICGRICPQDKLCEGNCVIEKGFKSVTIGSVEKYLTETAWQNDWIQPFNPRKELSKSVGIVGAGPAGLAAAEKLRREGYQVHVYDRYDRVGGLLIYGIPNFKLDKKVVARRKDLFEKSGIHFHNNVAVGDGVSFASIQDKHDAVMIATGVYKPKEMRVPGDHLKNIFPALAYLTASNRKGLGDSVAAFDSGQLDARGKRVIVVGGGDTAMDCVRTAIRQGALEVTCLYRRDLKNMPGSQREVNFAFEEGVRFSWLSQPTAYLGINHVEKIKVSYTRLSQADSSGRRSIELDPREGFTLEADMVIEALGFEAENIPALFAQPKLALTPSGTLAVRENMMTTVKGVFAAGDIVRGASLVVWAIKDGRDCADHISQYLRTSDV